MNHNLRFISILDSCTSFLFCHVLNVPFFHLFITKLLLRQIKIIKVENDHTDICLAHIINRYNVMGVAPKYIASSFYHLKCLCHNEQMEVRLCWLIAVRLSVALCCYSISLCFLFFLILFLLFKQCEIVPVHAKMHID